MSLTALPDGSVEGSISWTLLAAPPTRREADQLGARGVEHVRGAFGPYTRTLTLEGYGKDDPSEVLGLDKYELTLSETRMTLAGITRHHGPWDGQFCAHRETEAARDTAKECHLQPLSERPPSAKIARTQPWSSEPS